MEKETCSRLELSLSALVSDESPKNFPIDCPPNHLEGSHALDSSIKVRETADSEPILLEHMRRLVYILFSTVTETEVPDESRPWNLLNEESRENLE